MIDSNKLMQLFPIHESITRPTRLSIMAEELAVVVNSNLLIKKSYKRDEDFLTV